MSDIGRQYLRSDATGHDASTNGPQSMWIDCQYISCDDQALSMLFRPDISLEFFRRLRVRIGLRLSDLARGSQNGVPGVLRVQHAGRARRSASLTLAGSLHSDRFIRSSSARGEPASRGRLPRTFVSIVVSAVAFHLLGVGFVDRAGAAVVAPAALQAVACPTTTQCVAVGGFQDLLVSENGGRSWSARSLSDGHYLYGVACASATRCVAVGDAGTILVSGNGTQRWTPVSSGTTEPLFSVSCPGSGRCYAVGDGATVLTTNNSGMSWQDVASDSSVIDDACTPTTAQCSAVAIDDVACATPTQCAAVTIDSERDLYTQDGSNWSVAKVQSAALLALFPMNAITCSRAICVAAGNHGLLARSTDHGATWSFIYRTATTQNLDGIDCPTASRCLAVGSGGTILKSIDGGTTWTRDTSPTGETLLGMTCVTPEDCLAVGSGQTVVSTVDGGTDWVVRAGNAVPTMKTSVLVVGDSFAHTLALYVGRDASAYGVAFVDGGLDGCGLARGNILLNSGGTLGIAEPLSGPCAATGPGWPSVYRADVSQYRPDLSLLVLGPWDLASRLVDGHWLSPGEAAYDAYYHRQMATAVHILTSDGGRVVITTVPYVYSSGVERCVPRPATAAECPSEPERVAALNAVARQVAAENPTRVTLVDLSQHLSPNGQYDRTIDGVTVRAADGIHLSEPGGEWLTPWLVPRLLAG